VREADNLTTFMCRMSWISGSLNLLEPSGPHRTCYGTSLSLPTQRHELFRVDAPTSCSLTNTQPSLHTLLLTVYGYTARDLEDKENDIRNGSYFFTNVCKLYDKLLIYGTVINHLLQFLQYDSDCPQKSLSESPRPSLQHRQQ
jgi:hypothetical protein